LAGNSLLHSAADRLPSACGADDFMGAALTQAQLGSYFEW